MLGGTRLVLYLVGLYLWSFMSTDGGGIRRYNPLMLRQVLPTILGTIPALAWVVFLYPFACRIWGISMPMNLRKRREVRLNPDQLMDVGLTGLGVGFFIYLLAEHWFRWLLYRNPADQPSIYTVAEAIGLGVVAGVLNGWCEGIRQARAKLKQLRSK